MQKSQSIIFDTYTIKENTKTYRKRIAQTRCAILFLYA
ncbi:hypothetical protein PI172_0957 [Prevotella intermedia]|uniref:Uncharacterized protein n=1 Tax=Prevotella intermedia TaxID=28131 RepID=A0AAD1BJZ1_PREIN|nr:hypothetical protein PIN17_A1739 [Prevotella intermedia 17]BAR95685.1 hypothetical protein PI172_0957 [Prevotella intermedia]